VHLFLHRSRPLSSFQSSKGDALQPLPFALRRGSRDSRLLDISFVKPRGWSA
jgi:hypothetical protein